MTKAKVWSRDFDSVRQCIKCAQSNSDTQRRRNGHAKPSLPRLSILDTPADNEREGNHETVRNLRKR